VTVVESPAFTRGVPYGADVLPGTSDVLVTGFIGGSSLVRVRVGEEGASTVVSTIRLMGDNVPLGTAPDGEGHAFIAHPADHALSIVDLDGETARAVRWLDETGPSWVEVAGR
jgi:hypothetical protein